MHMRSELRLTLDSPPEGSSAAHAFKLALQDMHDVAPEQVRHVLMPAHAQPDAAFVRLTLSLGCAGGQDVILDILRIPVRQLRTAVLREVAEAEALQRTSGPRTLLTTVRMFVKRAAHVLLPPPVASSGERFDLGLLSPAG